MKKSTLAVLLVLAMLLGLLAGCSSKPAQTPTTADTTTDDTTNNTTDAPAAPDATDTPDDTTAEAPAEVSYPLVTDGTTFTVWWPNELTSYGVQDYNERYWFQHMEELTGVHLDFSASPSVNAANEQYNLMLVSGDVSDFVYQIGTYHTKGLDNAIEDGWYYDMIDYLDYLPNMSRVMFETEERAMQAITDSGYLAGLPMLVTSPQAWVNGLLIRQDLLDKYEYETPTTIDELGKFLEAVSANEASCERGPLWMNNTAFTGLEGAFGIGSYSSFLYKDGKVTATVLEDGYRQYIETMADWYARRLVDQDFAGNQGMVAIGGRDDWRAGAWAVTYDCFVYLDSESARTSEDVEGFNMVPYAVPALNEGDVNHTRDHLTYAKQGMLGISTTCENIELACRYWDYGYSDEAYILANYGPEDKTMYFDEQGNPHYTDYAMNPTEENWIFNTVQKYYMLLDAPFHRIGDREQYDISETQKACGPAWTQGDDAYTLPVLTTTSEEGEKLASIMSDIKTYIEEQQAKFITGQQPMSEFDNFVSTIRSMGIEDAIAIYETALERYNERAAVVDALRK